MSKKKSGSAEERIAQRIEELSKPKRPLGLPADLPPAPVFNGELTKRERKRLEEEARFSSLRAYRRAVDQTIAWALLGKISTKAACELATTIRTASELLMSEHILAATGRVDLEPDHIDGAHGGAPIMPGKAPDYVSATVERRVGIGNDGNPIDETRVFATGGPGLLRDTPFAGPNLEQPQPYSKLPPIFDD